MSPVDIILIILIIILLLVMVYLTAKLSELKNTQQRFTQSMEQTRKEVSDSIQQNTRDANESMKQVIQIAEKISMYQKDTKGLAESLKYLLQSPKHRGIFGEEILERMLEDMLPSNLWDRQCTIKGTEKFDVVIKFKGLIMPIDSKFPKEDYERYLSEENTGLKKKYWHEYKKKIKDKIRDIRSKYIMPEAGTTDFALMFIPSESIYYETISKKNFIGEPNELYEYARQNKVFPISPNTLYVYLQFILKSIKELEILEKAREIQKKLIDLNRNFNNFFSQYSDIGSKIDAAKEAFRKSEKHINTFKKRLDGSTRIDMDEE